MTNNIISSKLVSFKGCKIYVGIDVHSTSWKVTIRFNGIALKTFSASPNVEELVSFLNNNYPEAEYHSVYEAGFCGFSVHRELLKQGINNIVINPADIPLSDKDKRTKSDTRDSRRLAEVLEKNDVKAIYVPSKEDEAFRAIFRLREQMKKDKRREMNRIKSFMYTKGVKLGKQAWSKKSLNMLREKVKGTESEFIIITMLDHLEKIKQVIIQISQEIAKLIKQKGKSEEREVIQSAPGIGPEASIVFLAEIINPNRFKSDNDYCSYMGLTPDTYSSGDHDRSMGLTNRRNGKIRHVIIEAAWVAIRIDPELALAFSKLTTRMKNTNAIIRIAKKLAIRIRHIWMRMELYKLNVNMINNA